MMIMVSKDRWLGTPEAVYRKINDRLPCKHCAEDALEPRHTHSQHPEYHQFEWPEQWVARMPSGALEWLTDDEWEQLNKLV